MRRKWMMGLAGGGAAVAMGIVGWMLLSGESVQAGERTSPAAERDPGHGAPTPVETAASSPKVTETPPETVPSTDRRSDAAKAIADLEARGELPVLDRTGSLTGIDADGNGVRDDLDRYIERTVGDPAQREAAVRLTRTIQQTLLVDTGDHVAVMTLANRHTKDLSCLSSRYGNDRAAGSEVRHQLHSLTTNTKARLLAYLRFNQALSGNTFRLAEGDGCE